MTYPMIVARPCAICDGTLADLLYSQRFVGLSAGRPHDGYEVVACDACGFCYADGIPEQAAFDRYYREMSKYEYDDSAGRETAFDRTKFLQAAAAALEFLPSRSARILEVGCATGGMLNVLRECGCTDLHGIDPSPACAAAAQRLYGLSASVGTLAGLGRPAQSCDFVMLLGVMEHVRDLECAVRALIGVLAPGGRAFLCVPDASRYSQAKDGPYQEFSVEHINFFGPESLANLMGGYGFRDLGYRRMVMEYSHRTLIPVFCGAYELDGVVRPPARDDETAPDLVRFIEQSAAVDRQIHEVIGRLADSGRAVVVWGTGAHTLRLLATSPLARLNVLAYVDSNPHYHGTTLHGAPVVAPAELVKYDAPVLISSRVFQDEIAAKIRDEMKLPNEVITLYTLD